MKRLIPLLLVMLVVGFAMGGCARPSPVPAELPSPTVPPTKRPIPTEPPSSTATIAPTEPSTPTEPAATEVPAEPPASSNLGDVWTRPFDEMVMIYIPEGEFEMGSTDAELDAAFELCYEFNRSCEREWCENEQPVHTVGLDTFWIDRTEVTNAQYKRCVDAGACQDPGFLSLEFKDPAKADHPKVSVNWHDAQAYCEWAGGRLPTEAEWEYTARGPEGRVFPWGDEFDGTRLNYCDVNCANLSGDHAAPDRAVDDGYVDTAPVGSYPDGGSWCGALDLAGNVDEWTADWWSPDYYESSPSRNPTGPTSGEGRVVRGGSFLAHAAVIRGALRFRQGFTPSATFAESGFRCAQNAD